MDPNLKKQKENSTGLEKYARYSGIAFQMTIIILLFVWGGLKLDQKYFEGRRLFVIIFSLLGVFISLYIALKDFIHTKEKK